MAAKKKSNGNLVIIILSALSAAVAAGTAAAIEGITKRILNKRKGGKQTTPIEPESTEN